MTNTEEHKEWIKKYLKDNNLTPFQMLTSTEGVLKLIELRQNTILNEALEHVVLIDKSTIDKQHNGYLRFIYRQVYIGHSRYYSESYMESHNKKITQEHINTYHIREDNIVTKYVFDKAWKALFFKKYKKTKAINYLRGYMYQKDDKHTPFNMSYEREKFVSHYELTLNV